MSLPRRVVFLFFFLLPVWSSANRELDSLLGLLKEPRKGCKTDCITDTLIMNIYERIGEIFQKTNPDSAFYYHDQALAFAGQAQKKTGAGFIADFLELQKGRLLMEKGWNHFLLGKYDEAMRIFSSSKTIALKFTGNRDTAISVKALKLQAACLGNMGIVYRNQGNYIKALANYMEALRISEKLGNLKSQGIHMGNIGVVYEKQQEYTKAYEYLSKSLKIREALNDRGGQAITLNNIGLCFMNEAISSRSNTPGLFNKSLDYFFKALRINESLDNKRSMATNLGNIGLVYNYRGDSASGAGNTLYAERECFPKALHHYYQALELCSISGDKKSEVINLGNVSYACLKLKKYALAEQHAKKCMALATELRSLEHLESAHEMFAMIYEALNQHERAFGHYKKYILYRDSISNEENTKNQTRIEMQYVFDKQQAADSIRNAEQLKQEALRHDQEIAQQKAYTIGGAIGFVLMLVVAGVSFNAYRSKQRANAVISEQKLLVEAKQKEILDSIYYARRIQNALMPKESVINKILSRLKMK
jgi:tetratricopeptide (TPR) repeat protein